MVFAKLSFSCEQNADRNGIDVSGGGGVVSGTLIGGAKYFELFAKEFSAAWPFENKDDIRDIFAENGNIYKPSEGGDETIPPPHFIHLADARVHFPDGSLPSNKGVLWRGKLNAVSGFSLGSILR